MIPFLSGNPATGRNFFDSTIPFGHPQLVRVMYERFHAIAGQTTRVIVSTPIQTQLEATGRAQVIALLKNPPLATAAGLESKNLSARARDTAGTFKELAASIREVSSMALSQNGCTPWFEQAFMGAMENSAALSAPEDLERSLGGGGGETKQAANSDEVTWLQAFSNLGAVLFSVDTKGYETLVKLQKSGKYESLVTAPLLNVIPPYRISRGKVSTGDSWGLDAIQARSLWKKGITGKGIVVGHLGGWVDGKHPALKGAVQGGAAVEIDERGRPKKSVPDGYDAHATHTAGTIAGRSSKDQTIGVAPEATLCCLVATEPGNRMARILGGLDEAVKRGARVIFFPFANPDYHGDFALLLSRLRELSVLPVVPIGNDGPETSDSPANGPRVLSSGASTRKKEVAGFSSSQAFIVPENRQVPSLVAPGEGVVSCVPGGSFATMAGTTMAAAHVTGLVALLFSAFPEAAPADVETAILDSCTRLGSMPVARANRGIPNAPRALSHLETIMARKRS